ncbi:DNA-binding MarR family transcriptional regulator [Saccharothrix tamanrassetensis]|uniref:DNA-binding MarR family transcriptional regulator n=1 Tax=Saccharothrix tamanrassetensis TaxID=1051531 RepID=A0A841CIB3_9PSEU|nr:MarR family transcriptional regulator [Saccharothrix tamanrassetensis]MBB5956104.1 DNA-binding MarR family transcriptional regulator [Saccharothrix tamanrassetensis]
MDRYEASDALLAWLYAQQGVDAVRVAMSERVEAAAGCSLSEHEALYRIDMNGRLPMSELSELLAVSPSGVTRLVERLVRRGWVERSQLPDNRRVVYAALTDEGRRVLKATTGPTYRAAVAEEFAGALNDRDVADLKRIGRKLLEAHGKWDSQRFAPG